MIFKEQAIKKVFLIKSQSNIDERGLFRRHYCEKELVDNGINFNVKQGNISENLKKHTLRGFHYQKESSSKESKIISCISGSIYNVVVDLRNHSETFLKWQSFYLTSENKDSLYVPVGCANAFLTLEDNSWIHYYMNDFFKGIPSLGFRYNDPAFSIPWPVIPKYISVNDKGYPDLDIRAL